MVIITFNEEKNIERCLQSVKPVADEIVVVDSLSTDRTKEICKTNGVIFFEQPFLGYIEQKNYALSKTTYPFAFSIDADEELSKELILSIQHAKKTGFSCDGYAMNRLCNYCGQWIYHGNYYPDRKIRLVNVLKSKWGGANPHDKLIMPDNTKITRLKGDLLHHAYSTYEEHVLKVNKYSTIGAEYKFKCGVRSSYFKIIVNPAWAFFHSYVIKLGFLDGINGFIIARYIAFETFLKYTKLMRLQRKDKVTENS